MVDKQCPSCGGFCKSGCERENVRPQREWVGLTDEEMREVARESQVAKQYKVDIPARCKVMEVTPVWSHISHFAELIESKLKEKNCLSAD